MRSSEHEFVASGLCRRKKGCESKYAVFLFSSPPTEPVLLLGDSREIPDRPRGEDKKQEENQTRENMRCFWTQKALRVQPNGSIWGAAGTRVSLEGESGGSAPKNGGS